MLIYITIIYELKNYEHPYFLTLKGQRKLYPYIFNLRSIEVVAILFSYKSIILHQYDFEKRPKLL